jgi:hypothetical protein
MKFDGEIIKFFWILFFLNRFFNQIFCKLLNFISFVSVLVTVLTLVAMTIDRYIYVVRPFENLKWRKPSTVLLLSIIIWLSKFSFVYFE